ncbi:hypothetical protein L211DRAFT_852937 [Terfezia boudieri ATCC MYA-4762]|uniref:Uncharacterized protein n=1 Tax=Terfezia boudieri ATCC MYA-4762 TaxID=1051890 RepID=A0A3N4LA20_9PEZI|nr:hypothetical protein L211DRAFT_852937 [Terfezia boudieri ATCC MYA-4762]
MGFFSNLIGFVQSYFPFSPMGIVTTPPRLKIQTEEGIKAAIIAHRQHIRKKKQTGGRKAKKGIPMTATKAVNLLPQTQKIMRPTRVSPSRPESPRTKIQKSASRMRKGRRLAVRCAETTDSPCLLARKMDIDDEVMGTNPVYCPSNSYYDMDTPMEDSPSLDILIAGDWYCDVEMLDVDSLSIGTFCGERGR